MNMYLLGICIASYNRKDVLIPDLKSYFSLNDMRFKVIVQDDGSNNGTLEELELINDTRLSLRRNPQNLGALPNAKAALSNNYDCEYVLNLNDKDRIDSNVLPLFLDFLEKVRPQYGYVVPFGNRDRRYIHYTRGRDAIRNLGYLSDHPSGYFWKTTLFESETQSGYYLKMNSRFDYQFDVLLAHCAVEFDGYKVFYPLITPGVFRKELSTVKTATYTEDTLFFGVKKRLETFAIYLEDLYSLNIALKDKHYLSFQLLQRTLYFLTVYFRAALGSEGTCYHYNLKKRLVKFPELTLNLAKGLLAYSSLMKGKKNSLFVFIEQFVSFNKYSFILARRCLLKKVRL